MKTSIFEKNRENVFKIPAKFSKEITENDFKLYIKFTNNEYSINDLIDSLCDGSLYKYES